MRNTSLEQLDKWMSYTTETQHLEFKEAKDQMPENDICRYCVAIANEGGGQLILGITDKKPRKVVGTNTIANPIKDSLRQEITLIPETVIRELVANALIHQDVDVCGASVMIEIYSDRVEISNPGKPVVSIDRFIDEYQSRNERLAALMRRMGICEEKGSGIDKVIYSVEAYQLPAPNFIASGNRTIVKLFGYRPFDEMSREDRIRACYQHACLRWVMNKPMTNQTLRERFKLSESKSAIISQVISFAIDAEKIKTDEAMGGSRKFARYLPIWA
jgi:predicted HTH transcriptional regulator